MSSYLEHIASLSGCSRVPCPLRWHAEHLPDGIAFIDGDGPLSYAQIDTALARWVGGYAALGSKRVAIRHWNSVRLVYQLFAAWRCGVGVLLLSPRLPESAARTLVSSTSAAPVEDVEPCGNVGNPASLRLSHLATMMLTSGTSAAPRLIAHSVRNHLASAASCAQRLRLGPGKKWLWSLPSFHVGGMAILWRCFASGATVQLMPRGRDLAFQLSATPPTILSLVPTQLYDLISSGVTCPSDVEDVIVGGAALSPQLLSQALELGYPVRTTYGMTETTSMVTLSDRWKKAPQIMDAGTELGPATVQTDTASRILIRGDVISSGEILGGQFIKRKNEPFLSPDYGQLLADGRLRILSRRDDVIISGGENISLKSIRDALLEHENVQECSVIPVPDDRYGQRPVAFVRVRSGDLQEHKLLSHLSEMLPVFATPDRIFSLPEPEEGALKIPRSRLVEIATRLRDPS